jgi:hypothetical protein
LPIPISRALFFTLAERPIQVLDFKHLIAEILCAFSAFVQEVVSTAWGKGFFNIF